MTIQPIILIDTREQAPLTFAHYLAEGATLYTGDYSVKGLEGSFAVERKTVPDLVHSLTAGRARFTRELSRMRGYAFKRLLVVGSREEIERGEYRSKARPAAILGSLAAFEVRFDLPTVFAPTPADGAALVERWAFYVCRERLKEAEALQRAAGASRSVAPCLAPTMTGA